MNKWIDDKELFTEIARYAGDSAGTLLPLLEKWRSSLPLLRDTLTPQDLIEKSKSQQRTKKFWMQSLAAGMVAVLVIAIFHFNRFSEKNIEQSALCKAVIGDVLIKRGQQYLALHEGMIVYQHDTVICNKSSMAVFEVGAVTLRIEQNSELEIETLFNKDALQLNTLMNKGLLVVSAGKLKKADSVTVKTKTAVAGIRGTTFMVKSDSRSTKLVVLNGKVLLSPRLPDMPNENISGIVLDEGKSVMIDDTIVNSIQKAIKGRMVPIEEIIQQSVPVTKADETTIQMLRSLQEDFSKAVTTAIEDDTLHINDIYGIQTATPYKNDIVITTEDAVYYSKDNIVVWKKNYDNVSKPFIWKGNIVFQSGNLVSLDLNGNTLWQIPVEGEIVEDGIIAAGNELIVPLKSGLIYFVDNNGRILHTVNCNASLTSRPVLFGEMICVTTEDGYLYAIDSNLGVNIYRKKIGTVVHNGIIANYPELYIITPSSIQKMHMLRDEIVWVREDSEIVTAIGYDNGLVYATRQGIVSKIKHNGTVEWKKTLGGEIPVIYSTNKGILCVANNIFYYIAGSGEVLWSYTLPSKNSEILSSTSKIVYIRRDNALLTLRL